MELMINTDIVIPKEVPLDKYAKYGTYFPKGEKDRCSIIRSGIEMPISNNRKQNDRVFCFPGDLFMNNTTSESSIFIVRLE